MRHLGRVENAKFVSIGDRLRILRGGQSQTEFAEKLNIPFRTYQRYEAGEGIPKAEILHRVASICTVTVDWILTGATKAPILPEDKATTNDTAEVDKDIEFGRRLEHYIRQAGLSKKKFAEKMDIPLREVLLYVKAADLPDVHKLPKMAQTLNISVDELLTGTPSLNKYDEGFFDLIIAPYLKEKFGIDIEDLAKNKKTDKLSATKRKRSKLAS